MIHYNTTYPFAKIAAHFKLPYLKIILAADYLRGRGHSPAHRSAYNTLPLIVLSHINYVNCVHKLIMDGEIPFTAGYDLYLPR